MERADKATILRVLEAGGHIAESSTVTTSAKYTLCSWEGRRPGRSYSVTKKQFEGLYQSGYIEPFGSRTAKGGVTVSYYQKCTGDGNKKDVPTKGDGAI